MLYVGDTLYEHEPIIFPKEGSIITWLCTIDFLISFVRESQTSALDEIKINCGHSTAGAPALELLLAVKSFVADVLCRKERVRDRWNNRNEQTVMYKQGGGRFALICPERLVLEAGEVRL
jgi:hypothetical protein